MVGLECTDRKPIGHRGLMHSVWCINNIQYLHQRLFDEFSYSLSK